MEETPRETMKSTAKIAMALAKAQAKIEPPQKNKTVKVKTKARDGTYNGEYSFDYADYAAIVAAVRGPLSENEIAWTHLIERMGNSLVLVTKLIHSSGEELLALYPLPNGQDAKDLGGAMTYGKRYCLSCLTGCSADDDLDVDPANTTEFKDRNPPKKAETTRPATKIKEVIPNVEIEDLLNSLKVKLGELTEGETVVTKGIALYENCGVQKFEELKAKPADDIRLMIKKVEGLIREKKLKAKPSFKLKE